MDVREKLVELLAPTSLDFDKAVYLADYLVQNGVTLQEWISVEERLPKTGERVLVCIGAVFEAFIDDDGKWQRYYSAPLKEVVGEPTHWMPLPEPPKNN